MNSPSEQASVAAPPAALAPKRTVEKYGLLWSPQEHALTIEMACYKMGLTVEEGGLGAEGHFREAAMLLWGEENKQKQFIWSPWADKMLELSLLHKYLAVSGCASPGKSDFYAIYAIINWLADPANTSVLITSTSLRQ